ncbi:MAG: hypothetical protein Q4C65_06810 [Eubacteriales bacterium]|nr:hypothetical protein [Eubacteriales bacterium]
MRKTYDAARRLLCLVLTVALLPAAALLPKGQAQAAAKTFRLEQARALALSNSREYTSLESKLSLAEVQYVQSVKSIALKKKNQSTFRWSPLLNFKLPEKPDLSDEFEYTYKPLELQSEIDSLKHERDSVVYSVYEEVSLAFLKVYMLQEKVAFEEERLEAYEGTLKKNKARLTTGQAKQADIDAIEKKLDTIENSLASNKRNLEAEKEKLSDLTGLDVSVSYRFASPFVEAEIDRGSLQEIIDYTLENDHSLYAAETAAANALLAMNTNYDLMRSQYGSKMNGIDSFISQARRGEKLDSAAFRKKYDELLQAVDAPWQGSYRILFIKIPKEWLKGQIDGIRYVEDEPYVLYETALEYQDLRLEEESVRKELEAQVKEGFENYISTRNAWQALTKQTEQKKEELSQAAILNSLGEMTYEEYAAVQEEYEDLQMDELDALSLYSETLYSFDKLTCGAVSRLLEGTSADLQTARGGESYIVEEEGAAGVYYYIRSLAEGNVFELGISVPDDYEIAITEYELWVNGQQVGERTAQDKALRHLALDLDNVERAFIRLYADGEFVDDCDIDPSAYSGELSITKGYRIEKEEERQVASYETEQIGKTGLVEISITPEPDQEIAAYSVRTEEGSALLGETPVAINRPFRYLQAAQNSLEKLRISFYDEAGNLLYEAVPRTSDQTIQRTE